MIPWWWLTLFLGLAALAAWVRAVWVSVNTMLYGADWPAERRRRRAISVVASALLGALLTIFALWTRGLK